MVNVNVIVDPKLSKSLARQIVETLLDAVASGRLGAGDRLPSVRRLSVQALVNPNTVSKAYRDLEFLGIVVGRRGAGVFVTQEGPVRAREDRQKTTLIELRRAIKASFDAGHSKKTIQAVFEEEFASTVLLGSSESVED